MTAENRIGTGLSQRDLRRWAISGAGIWLPTYLRDSERHHGLVPGYCVLPRTFRLTAEQVKHPEEQLPALLIVAPGLADEPERQADLTWQARYSIAFVAIVHGADQDEAELQASIYGLAIKLMVLQQAGAWAGEADYIGPDLTVESIEWEDEDYTAELPPTRRRTLAPAAITFSVVFRYAATSRNPEIDPLPAPEDDPGNFPEIVAVELQIEREAIA